MSNGSTFHYGMPLYGAAWPKGNQFFVCGGGGQSASGIKNRCVSAQYANHKLSDQLSEINFGLTSPIKMAVTPDGKVLLFAIDSGGLRRFNLLEDNGSFQVSESPITPAKRVADIEQEIKCLAFSSDASLLALGCDSGSVIVLKWPSMKVIYSEHASSSCVRDVDFSPSYGNELLASTHEDGSCKLWDIQAAVMLYKLALPKALEGWSFNKCRFARDGSARLYALLNHRSKGSAVAEWEDVRGTASLKFKRTVKFCNDPGTAFDIHPHGTHLAVGSSEGDLYVLDASRLRHCQRSKKPHMIFITAVAFAASGHAVMSVGADGRAHVIELKPLSGGPASRLLKLLALLLVVLLSFVLLVFLVDPEGLQWFVGQLADLELKSAVHSLQRTDVHAVVDGGKMFLGYVASLLQRIDYRLISDRLRHLSRSRTDG